MPQKRSIKKHQPDTHEKGTYVCMHPLKLYLKEYRKLSMPLASH